MAVEYEIKLLGIIPEKIRDFLGSHNVKRSQSLQFKRVIFDTMPTDPTAWIRLRSDGQKTTLTYKKTHSKAISGTEEIEVSVDNFEDTQQLLTRAGLKSRNYQENAREVYHWMNCEITIDSWPRLEPYVEIEADDQPTVEACLKEFAGLYQLSTTDSTDELYAQQGIDLRSIAELKFTGK